MRWHQDKAFRCCSAYITRYSPTDTVVFLAPVRKSHDDVAPLWLSWVAVLWSGQEIKVILWNVQFATLIPVNQEEGMEF